MRMNFPRTLSSMNFPAALPNPEYALANSDTRLQRAGKARDLFLPSKQAPRQRGYGIGRSSNHRDLAKKRAWLCLGNGLVLRPENVECRHSAEQEKADFAFFPRNNGLA
jgi:hypothetical protein